MMARRGIARPGRVWQSVAKPRLAMAAFLAAAAIASPSEVFACRLHSVWHYPWPQRCGVGHAVHRSLAEPKDWYVEIVLTPQVLDEISHGVGIEKIKQLHGQ